MFFFWNNELKMFLRFFMNYNISCRINRKLWDSSETWITFSIFSNSSSGKWIIRILFLPRSTTLMYSLPFFSNFNTNVQNKNFLERSELKITRKSLTLVFYMIFCSYPTGNRSNHPVYLNSIAVEKYKQFSQRPSYFMLILFTFDSDNYLYNFKIIQKIVLFRGKHMAFSLEKWNA